MKYMKVARGTTRYIRRLLAVGAGVPTDTPKHIETAARKRHSEVLTKGFLNTGGARFERVAHAKHFGVILPEDIEKAAREELEKKRTTAKQVVVGKALVAGLSVEKAEALGDMAAVFTF